MTESSVTPKESVSLVIPIYNEEGNIAPLVQSIQAVNFPTDFTLKEVLLIDDGSVDGSVDAVRLALNNFPELKLLQLERNYGQTSALSAGFHHAQGDIVICLDGDLQNNPEDIPLLLAKMKEGYDVVSGWRKDRKDEWLRTQLSKVANNLIGKVTGLSLHDYGCTLKAYRRKYLNKIKLYGEMHRFIPIYLQTVGAKVCEIPVQHRERSWGTSKYGLNRTFKVVLDLMVIRFLNKYSNRPIYLFGKAGFFSLGISVLSFIGMIYKRFFDNTAYYKTPLPEFTLFSLFFGILFLLLGMLAELLMRVYYEAQDKPTYHIKSIEQDA